MLCTLRRTVWDAVYTETDSVGLYVHGDNVGCSVHRDSCCAHHELMNISLRTSQPLGLLSDASLYVYQPAHVHAFMHACTHAHMLACTHICTHMNQPVPVYSCVSGCVVFVFQCSEVELLHTG